MALATVMGVLVAVMSFKVWVWLTRAIVEESQCYQKTRWEAARARPRSPNVNAGLGSEPVLTYDDPGAPSLVVSGQSPALDGSVFSHGNPFWNQPPQLRIFNDDYQIGNRCR